MCFFLERSSVLNAFSWYFRFNWFFLISTDHCLLTSYWHSRQPLLSSMLSLHPWFESRFQSLDSISTSTSALYHVAIPNTNYTYFEITFLPTHTTERWMQYQCASNDVRCVTDVPDLYRGSSVDANLLCNSTFSVVASALPDISFAHAKITPSLFLTLLVSSSFRVGEHQKIQEKVDTQEKWTSAHKRSTDIQY